MSQVVHVSSFKSESLRGAAREIRPLKLRDGRPMYHLATARCRVDITTGKVAFLRVFTSFLAHFPYEKMHTDIDQFSPIDVFNFQTHEIIDNFTLSIFSKR